MIKKILFTAFFIIVLTNVYGQDYAQLDPKPYNPATDPDIDMYISSWKDSMPHNVWGSLIVRDIFTKCETGDPLKPKIKGAVLVYLNSFSHASLAPKNVTIPSVLKDEQIIFYIDSGNGKLKSGYKSWDLYDGIGILLPPGIEFSFENVGESPLTMYVISEPIPAGFTPNKEIRIADENIRPIDSTTGHWCHNCKRFFWETDGLSTLIGMCPVWFNPMTMGQPHSHRVGVEEIWFALDGDINILLGKQLRKLPVGSAFKIPPDGKTPHSTINITDKPIKLFWLMRIPGKTIKEY